ncbi:F-box domain [Arabidopsis suecica]|uniref:F-box domain n=1 Tax=Arabidopsis suecica TaxID=45249 RepID=A0A8T2HGI8_ARASU|nr:F-box domain [Arabidopsis suecica]
MDNSNFETLPEDLQKEILLWLSPKSLVKFTLVSKKCASIIRGEEFKALYMRRSMTRPRVLIVANESTGEKSLVFHTLYQEEEPLLSSCHQQPMRITNNAPRFIASQPILGLICLRNGSEVVIHNPGTKNIQTLPKIKAPSLSFKKTFFGYDGVTEVFKVLCITGPRGFKPSRKCHVYTMGSGKNSWRRFKCRKRHYPSTEVLCKEGNLYYGAQSISRKSLLMRFNVRSEEFSVIKLPNQQVNFCRGWNLVNYNGKIAVAKNVDVDTGDLQMWVLDDMGEWLSEIITIPRWKETTNNCTYHFKGTIGTGELVFIARYFVDESPIVLYYNKNTKNLRRFTLEELFKDLPPLNHSSYHNIQIFLNHIDSTWLM